MPSRVSPRRPGSRATECRQCGARAEDGARISLRDLCVDCGLENVREPARQLIARKGPAYDQWLRSCRDALERMPPA